jgi:hypothetical protein
MSEKKGGEAMYLPTGKDFKLDGMVLRHCSRMKVGDTYYCKVIAKARRYKHRRIMETEFYLCGNESGEI